jgi:Flp pilus assembly protein TadB
LRAFFIVNSAVLIIVTLIFSHLVVRYVNFKDAVASGIHWFSREFSEKRLQREVRRYSRTFSIKMSLVEKVELMLIDKSNIRSYLPFIDFYSLSFVCLLIFCVTFNFVYKIILFIPSTAVISFLFALIPVFLLDIMGKNNSESIRRRLAEFISVLNRWCAVKEDIFYAFEKSLDSGIGEPLRTFIRDMVIQVNRGINPLDALDMLQMKVDNPQFKDFIINIKQNIKHRGNIRALLTSLENQFYRIEEEYNRRRISTYRDRLLLYIVMFAILLAGYCFLKFNSRVEDFYLNTLQGKSLLTIFSILYAIGFYLTFKLTKFNH